MVKKYNKTDPHLEREVMKYSNPVPSRELILEMMTDMGRPMTLDEVKKALSIQGEDQEEGIRRRLIAMSRDGQLYSNRRGSYAVVDKTDLIRCVVQGHKDGFGFALPDDRSGDLFLSSREMMSVFPDDVVLVKPVSRKGSKREGVIVEVLRRATTRMVGRFFRDNDTVFVQPDNKVIAQDIVVEGEYDSSIAEGDYVVIEIVTQPTKRRHATGHIIEHLGDGRAAGMESRLAAEAHGIPFEWPEAVIDESNAIPEKVSEQAIFDRLDLRTEIFVTIDGVDSRDFDDAVCVKADKSGWLLKVAIADVAEYVAVNSALDNEAFNRGNSVYFPNEVIPMLPERLSNGICSLNPDVDRLVLVCDMHINKDGVVQKTALHEAVIHSHARFTYTQVAALLEGQGEHKLLPELNQLQDLYHALNKQRHKRGTIEFEVEEPFFSFGDDGKIEDITIRKRNVAHKIIEECMLAANVSVAKFLEKNKMPFLYRIHSSPELEKLEKLRNFLASFSLKLAGRNSPQAKDYAKLMEQVADREDAHLIQTVVLRSLQQAVYSPDNEGHFGLAYESYCHFTSPIRRYPDLLVHRAIKHVLRGGKKKDFVYDAKQFPHFGEHLSITERRADRASREAMDRLKCEFMQDKVGQDFMAKIVDVTSFGLFVECHDVYVQGLLHISALDNDYYDYDAVGHFLRGRRGGKVYRLGDNISVKVAKVDVDERSIDFVLNAFFDQKKVKKASKR